jgi:septal ring factor EnvC (AmiA/AmiB activator)
MLNFKTIKNIPKYIFPLFFLIFCGSVFADSKGQIININQSYQIAFTDLGNNVLKPGDIVKVSLNAEDFVYMQVMESSPILSKLGPSQLENFRTNLKDFESLAVGDEVVKVNQGQERVDHSMEKLSDTKNTLELSEQQIQKLEGDLALAKAEIKRLEESNEESKAKLNELAAEDQVKNKEPVAPDQSDDKELLGQLKTHLDNMRKLIDENN